MDRDKQKDYIKQLLDLDPSDRAREILEKRNEMLGRDTRFFARFTNQMNLRRQHRELRNDDKNLLKNLSLQAISDSEAHKKEYPAPDRFDPDQRQFAIRLSQFVQKYKQFDKAEETPEGARLVPILCLLTVTPYLHSCFLRHKLMDLIHGTPDEPPFTREQLAAFVAEWPDLVDSQKHEFRQIIELDVSQSRIQKLGLTLKYGLYFLEALFWVGAGFLAYHWIW